MSDLRKDATQQANYGNYWARKCLGQLDKVTELEADLDAAVLRGDLLREHEMYLDARLREAVRLIRSHAEVCSRAGESDRLLSEADRLDPTTEARTG